MEEGRAIDRDSLIRFGVGEKLEDAELGERVEEELVVDGDNSTVANFINSLPSTVRFAGQAMLNTDGGDLRLQKPVTLDAGFTLDVPLQIKDEFVVRDTIAADFGDLEDLTDPDKNVTVSAITLRFGYENRLPLGADVELTIAAESGSPLRTFAGDKLSIDPAPTNDQGAASGTTGRQTAVLDLGSSRDALRELTDGEEIHLRLTMTQKATGPNAPAARLRADDTIQLDLKLDVETSVNTND